MFKITCELEKIKQTSQDKTQQFIVYKNCHPCDFSDYQMFGEHSDQAFKIKTANTVAKIFDGSLTGTPLGLSLNSAEYKSLSNKVFHANDFTNYRYIGLFDENNMVENVKNMFGVPWIYSAIVLHSNPSEADQLATIWNQYFSWIYTIGAKSRLVEDRPYTTQWEKLFLFHLNDQPYLDRMLGTIQESSFVDYQSDQYYAIDNYFLKFLFAKHKNNVKCLPLVDNAQAIAAAEHVSSFSDEIYLEYKQALPKLVAEAFLEHHQKYRNCFGINKGYIHGQSKVFLDNNDQFYLASTFRDVSHTVILIDGCTSLGGILISTGLIAEEAISSCAQDKTVSFSEVGNNLYKLNCHNVNETLATLGDVSNREDIFENYGY